MDQNEWKKYLLVVIWKVAKDKLIPYFRFGFVRAVYGKDDFQYPKQDESVSAIVTDTWFV